MGERLKKVTFRELDCLHKNEWIPLFPSWLPYSTGSCYLNFSILFDDKYQWEIWKNTAGISASHFLTTNIMTRRCTPPYSITRWVSSHKEANPLKHKRQTTMIAKAFIFGPWYSEKGKTSQKKTFFWALTNLGGEPVPILILDTFFVEGRMGRKQKWKSCPNCVMGGGVIWAMPRNKGAFSGKSSWRKCFSHLETSAILFSHTFWNHSITIEKNAHFISRHYNNRCPKDINSETIKQIYLSPYMDSKGTKYSKL